MTELIIQTGKHQGKKIDLAGNDCVIGRHESCKIRIASADVSKQHCRLKHKQGGVYAKDLGSRNGTYVNDESIDKEVPLQPGDLLRVGPMTFLIAEGKSAPVADSPGAEPATQEGSSGGKAADDDLIAAWLSEGGDIEKSGQDTTVVVTSPTQNSAGKTAPGKTDAPDSPVPVPGDSGQKSVRDRAKAIICRWQKEHGKG